MFLLIYEEKLGILIKFIDIVVKEKGIYVLKLFLLLSLEESVRNYIGLIGFLFCVYLYVFEDWNI